MPCIFFLLRCLLSPSFFLPSSFSKGREILTFFSSAVHENTILSSAVSVRAHHSAVSHISLILPRSSDFLKIWELRLSANKQHQIPRATCWMMECVYFVSFWLLNSQQLIHFCAGNFKKPVFIIFGSGQRNLGGIMFLWNMQLCQCITKSVLISFRQKQWNTVLIILRLSLFVGGDLFLLFCCFFVENVLFVVLILKKLKSFFVCLFVLVSEFQNTPDYLIYFNLIYKTMSACYPGNFNIREAE